MHPSMLLILCLSLCHAQPGEAYEIDMFLPGGIVVTVRPILIAIPSLLSSSRLLILTLASSITHVSAQELKFRMKMH